jgi:sterol desaturase/sphingolipid hydroxylase (fatty acid hydroxylase superfamily)
MWISLLKGFCLGGIAHTIGFVMDITISKNSFNDIVKNIPLLYQEAQQKIQFNFFVITPVVYSFIDSYLLDHTNNIIQIYTIFYLLSIHGIGYYSAHKAMHQIKYLRKYHNFHHEFDKYIMPSIGNAVSTEEFLVAYTFPFIIGAYLTTPNQVNFIIPVSLISVFNNIIHCKELENIPWIAFLVSPQQHIIHHQIRDKHYAAPILNIDFFLDNDNTSCKK